MESIKRPVDLPLLTQQEPASTQQQQIQNEPADISQLPDSIEIAASPTVFDANTIQTPFAAEPASGLYVPSNLTSARLQELQQQLTALENQKQEILNQILQVETQCAGLELSQQQSPNPQTQVQILNLQKQLAELQSQLVKVDQQIQEILNEMNQL